MSPGIGLALVAPTPGIIGWEFVGLTLPPDGAPGANGIPGGDRIIPPGVPPIGPVVLFICTMLRGTLRDIICWAAHMLPGRAAEYGDAIGTGVP
jgi:hypothetical protein